MKWSQVWLFSNCVTRKELERVFCSIIALIGPFLLDGTTADAATIVGTGPDGHPISASADFSAAGDTLTVKLTNTTAPTLNSGGLLTGLEFRVTGSPSLTSDTGIQRTIDDDGAFVDTGSAQDLSWSLASLGGNLWQLNFNPNAEDGIVGPPSGGNYSAANGSIKGNAGHNPFAAEMAVFELNVPGIGNAPLPSVTVTAFLFGTDLTRGVGMNGGGIDPGGGPEAPEPAAWLILLIGSGALSLRRSRL
jgi:hypothetical protein